MLLTRKEWKGRTRSCPRLRWGIGDDFPHGPGADQHLGSSFTSTHGGGGGGVRGPRSDGLFYLALLVLLALD